MKYQSAPVSPVRFHIRFYLEASNQAKLTPIVPHSAISAISPVWTSLWFTFPQDSSPQIFLYSCCIHSASLNIFHASLFLHWTVPLPESHTQQAPPYPFLSLVHEIVPGSHQKSLLKRPDTSVHIQGGFSWNSEIAPAQVSSTLYAFPTENNVLFQFSQQIIWRVISDEVIIDSNL